MEEPVTSEMVETKKELKSHTKNSPSKATYVLVAVVFIAGVGAYWWRNDQANKQHKTDISRVEALQAQIDTLKKTSNTTTAEKSETEDKSKTTTTAVPTAAVKENVIASITSGNTAALEGYMAASVHVVIAASSGVFDHTPTQAVADLKYLDSATSPWDFALSATVLTNYGTGDYKDYFKSNSIVGKSADNKVVVFNFNDAGKINGVFMSASADLL